MSDFVNRPELLIAGIGVATLLFFALRGAAKSARAARKGGCGDGGTSPYAADTGGDCDGGGDGGGDGCGGSD
ncbi:MAG: hypothetical protein U5J99_14015 [Parvularculaceae bacterium]|nr:hypothetical protein [Parvularculaceae bacterium]